MELLSHEWLTYYGNLIHSVNEIANSFSIDPNWVKAIISQESQWNVAVARFERNYNYLYQPEKFTGPLNNLSTEMTLQKVSWGLGQVMGGLAREQGYTGPLAALIDPTLNISHIAHRIVTLKKYAQTPEDIFAGYNGGLGAIHKEVGVYSNQAYVDACRQYLHKFETASNLS